MYYNLIKGFNNRKGFLARLKLPWIPPIPLVLSNLNFLRDQTFLMLFVCFLAEKHRQGPLGHFKHQQTLKLNWLTEFIPVSSNWMAMYLGNPKNNLYIQASINLVLLVTIL